MSDAALKRRLARAVKRAADVLINSNYRITLLQGEVFNLEALREREIRKIRVVIDAVKPEDEQKVRVCRLPGICTKEIWCKRPNESGFRITEVR
ncbi:MAG: hypothetical protein ABFD52_08920 [Acidobacteriota bacterium]